MCFRNNNGSITTDIKYFSVFRLCAESANEFHMNERAKWKRLPPVTRFAWQDARRFDSTNVNVYGAPLIWQRNTSYLPHDLPLNSAISLTFLDYQTHHLQKCPNEMRSCGGCCSCMSNITYHSGTIHVKLPHKPHYKSSMMDFGSTFYYCWYFPFFFDFASIAENVNWLTFSWKTHFQLELVRLLFNQIKVVG